MIELAIALMSEKGKRGWSLVLSCPCLVLHVVIFFRLLGVGIDVHPSLFLLAFGLGVSLLSLSTLVLPCVLDFVAGPGFVFFFFKLS